MSRPKFTCCQKALLFQAARNLRARGSNGKCLHLHLPTGKFKKKGFFADATNIIHELSGRKQPKDNIYVNVVHAVDGGWNFDGKAMTNAEIGDAISKG